MKITTIIFGSFVLFILPLMIFVIQRGQTFRAKAKEEPANILIDVQEVTGPLPHTWQALAQGGEEYGVRMFENVIGPVSVLSPRYIRIDHIYDFYDVVSRDEQGLMRLSWKKLDDTVCDILSTGATPFFSLGYMPQAISSDGTVIAQPSQWGEWQILVQKTIERYSAADTGLCGASYDNQRDNIYYEVWNEPDHESFGKWNLYGGDRDYKTMYYYSSHGAEQAQHVRQFYLGGPATTKAYQNWIQKFLEYAHAYDLRVDFLSWHHYSPNPEDFGKDVVDVRTWLSGSEYEEYRDIPLVISEWGYDSNPNLVAHTDLAAAHAVVAIRNLIGQKLELAFMFEVKDGKQPSWGILTNDGVTKPRYNALVLLNSLGSKRIAVKGEGTFVKAIASYETGMYTTIIVNFDPLGAHEETVPVVFKGLEPRRNYIITLRSIHGDKRQFSIISTDTGIVSYLLSMSPNSAYLWEMK